LTLADLGSVVVARLSLVHFGSGLFLGVVRLRTAVVAVALLPG
jgi:hypothetical protein